MVKHPFFINHYNLKKPKYTQHLHSYKNSQKKLQLYTLAPHSFILVGKSF